MASKLRGSGDGRLEGFSSRLHISTLGSGRQFSNGVPYCDVGDGFDFSDSGIFLKETLAAAGPDHYANYLILC